MSMLEAYREWTRLVAVAKANPRAHLRCPKNDDAELEIAMDANSLVLLCPVCKAGTSVRLAPGDGSR